MNSDTSLWWFDDGNCYGLWRVWFKMEQHAAKKICSTCPVADVCLFYGMAFEDPYERAYVYGGATSTQRSQLGISPEQALTYYKETLEWYRVRRTTLVDEQEARSSATEQEEQGS